MCICPLDHNYCVSECEGYFVSLHVVVVKKQVMVYIEELVILITFSKVRMNVCNFSSTCVLLVKSHFIGIYGYICEL